MSQAFKLHPPFSGTSCVRKTSIEYANVKVSQGFLAVIIKNVEAIKQEIYACGCHLKYLVNQ